MVDFILRDEQQAMQKLFRAFSEKEIKPGAAERDETGEFPRAVLAKMAQQGFLGIPIPPEWGGAGADFLTYILAVEEFSRACASTGVIVSVHTSLTSMAILRYGSPEQQEKYLRKLTTGESLGAYALTEPGAGSDAASLRTQAALQGDHYALSGSKIFITSGGEADVYIVFATVSRQQGRKGISAFIVDSDSPGLRFGAKEKKMGLNASATTEMSFDGCLVPAANLLGAEGEGFKIAMSLLDGGRIGVGAQALGIAQAALDEALPYSQTREQFGQPIAQFQGVSFKLADMATQIEAARLLVYQAACLKEKGLPCGKEASMAKLFASDTALKCAIEAVQVLGGYGYTREFPVERYLRDAKVTQIYEGTNEIQRLVISKKLMTK